ncbi:hypothetical protein PR202_ga28014 [Eleusine coracana subsp. coracana]|uniref:Uncharacterized protein n=1 Tax=Eleusine coracana subsp. coracana TaxID=191504 RepID=A0AAV5DIP8_ELECO|nr:hypothetical protein PR202_ga28014 [Eleusine coracana subsp. coracana]
MADCDILGYTIPAGTCAIVNAGALARVPDYWESPERSSCLTGSWWNKVAALRPWTTRETISYTCHLGQGEGFAQKHLDAMDPVVKLALEDISKILRADIEKGFIEQNIVWTKCFTESELKQDKHMTALEGAADTFDKFCDMEAGDRVLADRHQAGDRQTQQIFDREARGTFDPAGVLYNELVSERPPTGSRSDSPDGHQVD